jgi:predicted ATPase
MALHGADPQVRWKNFRGFDDTGWITIKPLTILIGPNNSGKTSFFAPLLIMAQTVKSADAKTSLITRGPFIDAGSPSNLLNNQSKSRPLYLGFKFHPHIPKKITPKIGDEPPGTLEVTFSLDKKGELQLIEYSLSDAIDRPYLTKRRDKSGNYPVQSKTIRLKGRERQMAASAPPTNFLFSPSAVFRLERLQPKTFSDGLAIYLTLISFAFNSINDILHRLAYVGPLRTRPQRTYSILGEHPQSVGISGSDMTTIMYKRANEISSKLNEWVRRFEFGSGVRLKKTSEESCTIELTPLRGQGKPVNIVDSGFGISQVLPLIVQALTARTGSITIAEQPEIHLNPRLQSTLADLFVEMANTDHRVIVETHSEHLLLRLRTLLASRKIDASKVAVYYVESDNKKSTVKSVPLEQDGSIDLNKWPRGFFGDSLQESLALARAQDKFR